MLKVNMVLQLILPMCNWTKSLTLEHDIDRTRLLQLIAKLNCLQNNGFMTAQGQWTSHLKVTLRHIYKELYKIQLCVYQHMSSLTWHQIDKLKKKLQQKDTY